MSYFSVRLSYGSNPGIQDNGELAQIRALSNGQILPLYAKQRESFLNRNTGHLTKKSPASSTNRSNASSSAIPTAIVIAQESDDDANADVISINSDDSDAPPVAPISTAPTTAPVPAPAPATAPVAAPIAPTLAAATIAALVAPPTTAPTATPASAAISAATLLALAAHIPPRPAMQESVPDIPALVCPSCRTAYALTAIKPPDSWYAVFTGRTVGLFATA